MKTVVFLHPKMLLSIFKYIQNIKHFHYWYFYLNFGTSQILGKVDFNCKTLHFWSVCTLVLLAAVCLTFSLKSVEVLRYYIVFFSFSVSHLQVQWIIFWGVLRTLHIHQTLKSKCGKGPSFEQNENTEFSIFYRIMSARKFNAT